jgi:DNA polymerase-3 subunit delta
MLIYLYGENEFAIKQKIDSIKAQYVDKTGGDADMQTFDMSEHNLSDLLNAFSVVPMFVSSRLFIVRNLDILKLTKDQLHKLIDAVSDSTNVVVVDSKPDKRSVYFKAISKLKNAKYFGNLSPQKLVSWIRDRTQELGGSIDNTAINLLIERVGNDQWQLDQELRKLTNFNSQITKESIEQLVVPNLTQSAFMMIDAIVRKDAKKASEIYEHLITQGEADQMILGAITYQYRMMVLAKDNVGKGSEWQKELSVSPYAATKAQNLIKNIDMEKLKTAYQSIVDADMAIKTGELESHDALRDLIVKLSRN